MHRSFAPVATLISVCSLWSTPDVTAQGSLSLEISCDQIGSEFGSSIAAIGDLDGDGIDDFAVGQRRATTVYGPQAGRVLICAGADGTALAEILEGGFASWLGFAVAGTGDIDGDGVPDLITGAPSHGLGRGRVSAFSGADRSLLFADLGEPGMRLGWSVSGAGDVNADGYDDFIAGAPFANSVSGGAQSVGAAFVRSGRDGSTLFALYGDSQADFFGYSVAGLGDCNFDGFDDFAVGAHRDDASPGLDHGSVTVYSGQDGSVLFQNFGPLAGDRLGSSLAAAGDVDGDGAADVLVGAVYDGSLGTRSGAARVFSGADGSLIHLLTLDETEDEFGFSVAGVGDIDGDGHSDLLVGAPQAVRNSIQAGVAAVFSGASGLLIATFEGTVAGGQFGWSVARAGDLDADGYPEVLVGSVTELATGSVRAFDLDIVGSPPRHKRIGHPCFGANFRLPRVTLSGAARIGETFRIGLRGATFNSPSAVLLLGETPIVAPLDTLGLTNCTLYVDPYITVPVGTDAHGMASVELRLPSTAMSLGGRAFAQWIIGDVAAPHAFPIVLSDSLQLTIGD